MKAETFNNILKEPKRIAALDVDELREWAQQHPYSQIVQLMYAMRLQYSSEHLFNRQLAKTAIISHQRKVLFDLFEAPKWPVNKAFADEPVAPPAKELKDEKPVEPAEEIIVAKKVKEGKEPSAPEPKEAPESRPEETQLAHANKEAAQEEADFKASLAGLSVKDKIAAILERSKQLRQIHEKERWVATASKKDEAPSQVEPEKKEDEPVAEEKPNTNTEPLQSAPAAETEEESLEGLVLIAENEQPETTEVFDDLDEEFLAIENKASSEVAQETPGVLPSWPPKTQQENKRYKPHEETLKSVVEAKKQSKELTFSGWLNALNKTDDTDPEFSEVRKATEPPKEKAPKAFEEKIELFSSFVQKLPSLKKRNAQASFSPNNYATERGDTEANEGLVTETLATVYIKQKHYKKAIKAYQILKLKYPEKSSYFAAQILEIKNLAST